MIKSSNAKFFIPSCVVVGKKVFTATDFSTSPTFRILSYTSLKVPCPIGCFNFESELSVRKSIDPRIEIKQNENNSMPSLATISSFLTFSFSCNPSPLFNGEDRSVHVISQCEVAFKNVTHNYTTDGVREESYERKSDISYINFNCINSFTKKH
uniref:ZP domain-containing protein n=1 Tax=Strongyloides venezuelensis TaxID=75913 RepID=A0A0K0FDE0_STRVS